MKPLDPTFIIRSNYMLLQSDLERRRVFYLDVCEVLQINPLIRHKANFINKRIETARNHNNETIMSLIVFKGKRRDHKKALKHEHGYFRGRRLYKEMMKLYKDEYTYVFEVRKLISGADMFFVYMKEDEYARFFIDFIKVMTKKGFTPHPSTISDVWKPKKTFSNLQVNSTLYKTHKKKKR